MYTKAWNNFFLKMFPPWPLSFSSSEVSFFLLSLMEKLVAFRNSGGEL